MEEQNISKSQWVDIELTLFLTSTLTKARDKYRPSIALYNLHPSEATLLNR
jgi:hypothetical protein